MRPIQVSQWKKQWLESASELFTRGKKTEAKGESQAKEVELFQQIGKLQMELECLNKKSQQRIFIPGSDRGSVLQARSQLEAVK